MPDNSRRPADWYDTSAPERADTWYKNPTAPTAAQLREAGGGSVSGGRRKKHRRMKIISLAVCAMLVLAAVGVAGFRLASARMTTSSQSASSSKTSVPSITIPSGSSDDDEDTDSATVYDDFMEYFANYYTTREAVTIQQAALGTDITLTLAEASGDELTLSQIYELVAPAIVQVIGYADGTEYSYGTGVIFTADGYIITNTHIIEGCDAAAVVLSDGTEYEAWLVGSDEASDIAVLYIEAEGLPCAEFGDSEALQVGDTVVAIGNPLGTYTGTMTDGIISAINRDITYNGHTMTLLQTNAALNEGNSGGALVNAYGQVIGITNMKIMYSYYTTVEGIGFAIPSSVVKEVADQLIAYGVVLGEPTIGIVAGAVSAEAMALYGLPAGVYVTAVNEGSDALEKGLQVGDVITAVNGEAVTSVSEVNAIKEGFAVGDSLTLTIYRDGETFDLEIELVDKSVIG